MTRADTDKLAEVARAALARVSHGRSPDDLLFDFDVCNKCGSRSLSWVGFSKRALRRMRPSRDVQRCNDCGHSWRYTNGGRVTTKQYQEAL